MPLKLIHTTSFKDRSPESFEGATLLSFYEAFRSFVKSEPGEDESLFAAVPEPSLKKAVIYWRAVAAGGLKSYLSLSQREKRAAANAILSRYAKKFAALGAKGMSSGSGESRSYGVILARLASSISQILSGVPGGPPLFPAGVKPVLAGRGLTPVPGLLNYRQPDMAKGALGSGSKSFEAPFRAGAKSVPKAASQATPLAYFPARLPRRAF